MAFKFKTSVDLPSELARLRREKAGAEGQLQKLAAAYEHALLSGDVTDVSEVTANVHRQAEERARVAMCDARIREVQSALEAGDRKVEQDRRIANFKAALSAGPEVAAALDEYHGAAKTIVKALQIIAAAKVRVANINRDLPEGYAPMPDPEPFNGRGPIVGSRSMFGVAQPPVPGYGHQSILDQVRLGNPSNRYAMYYPPGSRS